MRPGPDEVLHFSENPTLRAFHPHTAPTAADPTPYVWAVDATRCPDYWFPRDCPRGMAWIGPATTPEDAAHILGPGTTRVHTIEYTWLPAMQSVRLYAYRLPARQFHPYGTPVTAHVTMEAVEALGPAEPVGDLLELHRAAGIQLRLVDNMWPWWEAVIDSTVEFSGIRLRNAAPMGTAVPYMSQPLSPP
jgi:hypothetical protein